MFVWCSLLFILGILAFLDSVFNMGEIFRQVNSVFFMLVSLALLVRTTTKMKEKKLESYKDEIYQLESRLRVLEEGRRKLEQH
jgi:hypothetical protein